MRIEGMEIERFDSSRILVSDPYDFMIFDETEHGDFVIYNDTEHDIWFVLGPGPVHVFLVRAHSKTCQLSYHHTVLDAFSLRKPQNSLFFDRAKNICRNASRMATELAKALDIKP